MEVTATAAMAAMGSAMGAMGSATIAATTTTAAGMAATVPINPTLTGSAGASFLELSLLVQLVPWSH